MPNQKPTICAVNFDDAHYIGSDNDGVYFDAADGPDGWYVSAVVDCNSSHFTETLYTDDGPYPTRAEALQAGEHGAKDWCTDNDVLHSDDDDAAARE